MPNFTDYIAENAVATKRIIHDCVDTGADLSLTTTEVTYPCDCAGYEYKSTDLSLWDNTTGIFSDSILDSLINIKWTFIAESAQQGRKISVRVVIPDPAGEVAVYAKDYFIDTQNVEQTFSNSTIFYNASQALAYGFKFYIVGDGAFTLKYRSILAVV